MGSIRVDAKVYEAVRHAQDDYTLGGLRGKDISDSEMATITEAITSDGEVSAEEKRVLDALKSGTSFTVTNGSESTPINPSTVSFPSKGAVPTLNTGRVMVEPDEGVQTNLPSYIPTQTKGAGTDVINSDTYKSPADAQTAFTTARSRMLDVNNWNKSVKSETSSNAVMPDFSLSTDADGNGQASVGDIIKIAPPGGATPMYVKVERVVDNPNEFAVQVRPCDASGNTTTSQHMYTGDATNTFRLTRDGNTVTNGFHGRNEVRNSGAENYLADRAMANGGRSFNWDTMGDAWRVDP